MPFLHPHRQPAALRLLALLARAENDGATGAERASALTQATALRERAGVDVADLPLHVPGTALIRLTNDGVLVVDRRLWWPHLLLLRHLVSLGYDAPNDCVVDMLLGGVGVRVAGPTRAMRGLRLYYAVITFLIAVGAAGRAVGSFERGLSLAGRWRLDLAWQLGAMELIREYLKLESYQTSTTAIVHVGPPPVTTTSLLDATPVSPAPSEEPPPALEPNGAAATRTPARPEAMTIIQEIHRDLLGIYSPMLTAGASSLHPHVRSLLSLLRAE